MDVIKVTQQGLPVKRIGAVAEEKISTSWLIESLWLNSAVGIIGAQPKSCKTWLGLEMAVSVASGTACLQRYAVPSPGPCLVYLAEDAPGQVRRRVLGICNRRGLNLETLDISMITSPTLRLDTESDQKRLIQTLENLKPRMLLLDPLVRLHRLDENSASEVSGLLGFFRDLQRRFDVAVVLTHHSSKRGGSRPGQALRGSSDLHAFGDSNIYLYRHEDEIELTVEHRSASAIEPFRFKLVGDDDIGMHLLATNKNPPEHAKISISARILEALNNASTPVARAILRDDLRVNNQRLGQALTELLQAGVISSTPDGFVIVACRPIPIAK